MLPAPVMVGQEVAADRQDPGPLRRPGRVIAVPRPDHALEGCAREVLGRRAVDGVGEEGIDGAHMDAVDAPQLRLVVAALGQSPARRRYAIQPHVSINSVTASSATMKPASSVGPEDSADPTASS